MNDPIAVATARAARYGRSGFPAWQGTTPVRQNRKSDEQNDQHVRRTTGSRPGRQACSNTRRPRSSSSIRRPAVSTSAPIQPNSSAIALLRRFRIGEDHVTTSLACARAPCCRQQPRGNQRQRHHRRQPVRHPHRPDMQPRNRVDRLGGKGNRMIAIASEIRMKPRCDQQKQHQCKRDDPRKTVGKAAELRMGSTCVPCPLMSFMSAVIPYLAGCRASCLERQT